MNDTVTPMLKKIIMNTKNVLLVRAMNSDVVVRSRVACTRRGEYMDKGFAIRPHGKTVRA